MGLAVLVGLPLIGVARPALADTPAASAVLSATPQWNGMAGNPGDASGQVSAARARCAAAAAATASLALRKVTKNESPSVPCSSPSLSSNA